MIMYIAHPDLFLIISDPPSAPDVTKFSSRPLDKNLFDISWTWANHDDSQLSYFEVQLDDTPSVRTQTSSIILSSNAPATSHTLQLVAVDMCGQRSSVATQVITTSAVRNHLFFFLQYFTIPANNGSSSE